MQAEDRASGSGFGATSGSETTYLLAAEAEKYNLLPAAFVVNFNTRVIEVAWA